MIAERYELVREIGRGGMGAVWLANDTVLGREVAIKRIGGLPGTADADLVRAEREARLAARLNHPHVIAVYDLVESDDDKGEHWLVMEYVEGVSLSALVRRDGALSPDQVAPLLAQTSDALAAAHASGIVHRDVKPSNILVTPEGQAKLGDFGIARAEADATLTQTGLVTGSPAYLAPEVASGGAATPASDVWALGATLFHALEGEPPYEVGDNLMGALYRIVNDEPPRPTHAGWLAPLLEVTMTPDPAQRWEMSRVHDFLAGRGGEELRPEPTTPEEAVVASGHTVALAPATADGPEPTGGTSPAPPPAAAATTDPAPVEIAPEPGTHARHRLPLVPLLIGAVVVAALVLGALLWGYLQPGDGERRTAGGPGSSSSGAPSSGDTSSGGTSSGTQPTSAGMRSFIEQYLADAPNDPDSTFQRLTPGFQRASGGIDSYKGYWQTIKSATLTSFSADPDALTVDYTVDYVRQDQSRATGDVHLGLTYSDGTYRIASEG